MQPNYQDVQSELILCKGGVLYYKPSSMSEKVGELQDVTDVAYKFLLRTCEFEEGLKLKDVFALMEKHIDFLDLLIGNWIKDILAESKIPCEKQSKDIEFLELYWHLESDKYGTSGLDRPRFDGQGTDCPYAIDFSPSNSLMELPIVLKKDAQLFQNGYNNPITLSEMHYTLLNILDGIIWELSFYGSPTKRQEQFESLKTSIEKSATEPRYEAIFDELKGKFEFTEVQTSNSPKQQVDNPSEGEVK
jgi:hypothetical protein